MGGANTKGSCSAHQDKNEKSILQLDPIQRLSCMIIDLTYAIEIQLKYDLDHCQLLYLQKRCIRDLVWGTEQFDISILQF